MRATTIHAPRDIRLSDVPKETLARLQTEITRAAPSKG